MVAQGAWMLWGVGGELVGLACVVAFRGVCMVARGGGMCGCSFGEHVWLLWGACMVALGGMHGCSGVESMGGCSRGHAWLLWGACMVALGGWHAWLFWGVCMVALGHAWLIWGACMVALWGGHAWDMTRYGETVNERVVRILLECILVY